MNWAELPTKLKAYILFLALAALPVLARAVWELGTTPFEPRWLILTGFALITVPFFLLFPSFNVAITVGDAYIMAIAMMYGVAPCVVATLLYTLIISLLSQKPRIYLYRVVFNTTSTVCVAWIYSTIYRALTDGSTSTTDIIIPAAVLGATFFLINSTLTSIAIAWSLGKGIIRFWATTCMPLAIEYSISTVLAAFITGLHEWGDFFPLAAAPFIGIAWGWIKLNKIRVMEAEKHLKEQEDLYLRTVESLALAVDAKDQTTYGHIRRVKVYSMGLARLCGIKDQNELRAIETGSLLHDIGKLAIDDYILNKPGRLSKVEFEKMKVHAAAGDEILQQVCFPFPVAKYVRYHHERWDGLGYPDGLKGEEIPLGARILAIADAFDAIRYSRPYKMSVETGEALEILKNQAGTVFDPRLVQLFTDNIGELEQEAARESGNAPQLSFRKYFETIDQNVPAELPSSIPQAEISSELISLSEFCASVCECLEFRDVFPVLVSRLKALVPFSSCVIYLDTGENRLAASYASGVQAEFIQNHVIAMGAGISGWAAAHRRPMMNTRPALDFQTVNAGLAQLSDALVVPIIHAGEALGTISLYEEQPQSYNRQHLDIMQMVADFVAPLLSESKRSEQSKPEDVVDRVTGVHRISYLTAVAPQLISSAAENRLPLSLIHLELADLSRIVRIYGTDLGDLSLKRIAECIKHELRETDVLVRYGYHGFVAVLPGVRDEQANRCAKRLKQQIDSEFSDAGQGHIHCRIGVSGYPKDGTTIPALLQSARRNLQSDSTKAPISDRRIVEFSHRT